MSSSRERNISGVGWLPYSVQTVETLARRFNGLISLGDGVSFNWAGNIDAQTLHFVTPAVADTAFEIPHGLSRIPVGVIVVRQTAVGTLYDPADGLAWTDGSLVWKCSAANVAFTVLVF